MDFDMTFEQEAARRSLRDRLEAELPEDWQGIFVEADEARQWSVDFCRRLGQDGWLTRSWPEAFGGQGATAWDQVPVQEELWAFNEPRGAQYMNVNWIGPAIMHFGSDAQKARFLPEISAGEAIWAQGFSEPEAGSDLASLRTTAELEDGHFRINGTKVWISYGTIAQHCFLLARSEPGSRRGAGLSVLLIDLDTPGITVRALPTILGYHRQSEIIFDDALVPDSCLLGTLHDGWRVTRKALSFERSGSARYARSARIIGLLESTHGDALTPDQRMVMVEALAFGRVTELMNYRVVEAKENDDDPRTAASVARIHNALLEQQVGDLAEDILGVELILGGDDPMAIATGEVEALWRNAPAATVTAGSYEIQTDIVAQSALGLSRS